MARRSKRRVVHRRRRCNAAPRLDRDRVEPCGRPRDNPHQCADDATACRRGDSGLVNPVRKIMSTAALKEITVEEVAPARR
ncbi:hypothetical protein Bphy_3849 [Paraburkholderia phymatum STM815]|uniref:Uncharacterized protein n=1 Tax=Paraburkholderia phymatum (strain DSM 17167 / CIP 108236 / LMG 21445 / STM815) TaxID=391038 RepID=B2JNM9_PARP8|nr:hypothetical protein Bphy_3849 [Paraburkholderia phymatum STM815]